MLRYVYTYIDGQKGRKMLRYVYIYRWLKGQKDVKICIYIDG